jgi:hypothetical protein
VLLGRKRLKERENTDPRKREKVNFHPTSGVTTMNTLNLIRKQINKAAALHNAQISHTSYRGVEYDTRCVESTESHGTFCYRGQSYAK